MKFQEIGKKKKLVCLIECMNEEFLQAFEKDRTSIFRSVSQPCDVEA